MTAYLLVEATISDEGQFAKYREAVMPLIAKFGGTHARGGSIERLEGAPDERRIALFEFPSMEAIHTFWNSVEYIPVKELRHNAAILDAWAIPGQT